MRGEGGGVRSVMGEGWSEGCEKRMQPTLGEVVTAVPPFW